MRRGFFDLTAVPQGWWDENAQAQGWFHWDLLGVSAPPPGGTGEINYWTGAAWVLKPVKYWTGAAWVTKPMKYWTGSAWVKI